MMAVLPGQPRESIADAIDDEAVAITRRRRLMRLLAGVGVFVAAAAITALLLPPGPRQTYLTSICIVLVFCGALPLVASLLQYIVVGLHRFFIGYEDLRPCYPRVAVVVPAWNEALVIGTTIERLLAMDYPQDRLRVYVVDDASTDATPDVVRGWVARVPERVRHLRRDKGGEGKAHTLNYGITQILDEPWAEAVLVIDADVLFEDSALRRMTRHLSRPDVGAVTAYIKEGTRGRQLPHALHRVRVHHGAGGGAPGAERVRRARVSCRRRTAPHAGEPVADRWTYRHVHPRGRHGHDVSDAAVRQACGVRGQRGRVGRGAGRSGRAMEAAAPLGSRQRPDLAAVLPHVVSRPQVPGH